MNKQQTFTFCLIILSVAINAQLVNVYTVMGEDSPLSDGISIDAVGNMFICDAVGDGSPQNPQGTTVIKLNQYLEMSIYVTGMQIPIGNCLDEAGNLYVSNLAGYLKKVTPEGDVSNFGNLFCCLGLEFDSSGNLYVAMPNSEGSTGNYIKRISPAGTVTTVHAGAPLYFVYGLAMDENDFLYAGNFSNGEIYRFDTVSGGDPILLGIIPDPVWGCAGFMDYYDEHLYIGGYWNRVVYRMSTITGEVEILAGTGEAGMQDGPADQAMFYKPNGIEVVPSGNDLEIYVTDDGNKSLRKIVISDYTGTEEQSIPENAIMLLQNYPNPFNPETKISFIISTELYEQNELPELVIYNVKGQNIKSYFPLFDCAQNDKLRMTQAGSSYSVIWDGTNEIGEPVPSGVYFYKLSAGDFSKTNKMLLLK